jgi:hypothetical protein
MSEEKKSKNNQLIELQFNGRALNSSGPLFFVLCRTRNSYKGEKYIPTYKSETITQSVKTYSKV